eukprot:TRINITY_DN3664_c0_g1_i1.p1 TRINITY_DN3664_c0_g1~~TRINITY_DN3664_c0_g1_i1.p1  ORF type:complete len:112 (-),score=16.49 TRINITY_DN3664_c0_g1_i1:623-958(-)
MRPHRWPCNGSAVFPDLASDHAFAIVRFMSSSPSSYMFFIRSIIPAIGSFSLTRFGFTLSSFKCKSSQFPFDALKNVMRTLLGLTTTLDFSGTISLFSFGIVYRKFFPCTS